MFENADLTLKRSRKVCKTHSQFNDDSLIEKKIREHLNDSTWKALAEVVCSSGCKTGGRITWTTCRVLRSRLLRCRALIYVTDQLLELSFQIVEISTHD